MASKQEVVLMALALKQGLITKEQIQTCMDLQAVLEQNGQNLPLLQIALKKKFLTPEQADSLQGKPVATAAAVDIPGDDRITIDGDTLKDDTVTIRDRDTTQQTRLAIRAVAAE